MRTEVFVYLDIYLVYIEIYDYGFLIISKVGSAYIYYQYAKYEPCTILHIDLGVFHIDAFLSKIICTLMHIYAKKYPQYAK